MVVSNIGTFSAFSSVSGSNMPLMTSGQATPENFATCCVMTIETGKAFTAKNGDSPQRHEGHEGKSPILLGDLCVLVRAFLLPSGRKRPVPTSHTEIRVVTQSLCGLISQLPFRWKRAPAERILFNIGIVPQRWHNCPCSTEQSLCRESLALWIASYWSSTLSILQCFGLIYRCLLSIMWCDFIAAAKSSVGYYQVFA